MWPCLLVDDGWVSSQDVSKRRRIPWGKITILGFALALIVGCMHWFAVVIGLPDPLDLVRPTAGSVLNWGWWDADREKALAMVTDRSDRYRHLEGISVIATQTGADCMEGQNNWKVHSGYRLSCSVGSYLYLAWNGDYVAGAKQFRAVIERRCVDDSYAARHGKPSIYAPRDRAWWGDTWRCGNSYEAPVSYANGQGVEGDLDLNGPGDYGGRYISGPSADELGKALSGYAWLARVVVYQEFYRDRP